MDKHIFILYWKEPKTGADQMVGMVTDPQKVRDYFSINENDNCIRWAERWIFNDDGRYILSIDFTSLEEFNAAK